MKTQSKSKKSSKKVSSKSGMASKNLRKESKKKKVDLLPLPPKESREETFATVATSKMVKLMTDLRGKWKEDEDGKLKDYAKPIQGVLPSKARFLGMSEKPFGFKFRLSGSKDRYLVHCSKDFFNMDPIRTKSA